jgi:hypothetical protein
MYTHQSLQQNILKGYATASDEGFVADISGKKDDHEGV